MDDLVQRRLKYIERQKQLHKESVDVDPSMQPVMGSGPKNRHGMPLLPVGQHEVRNWPVLDLGDLPDVPLDRWQLEVGGLVENPVTLSWSDFQALPQVDDVSDFHCVTTWSRFNNHWKGVRFRTIAELVVPKEDAQFVLCTGCDHLPGTSIPYTTNLPLARAVEEDVLLVHTWEGKPLPREHGGPGAHDYPQAVRMEGHQVDPADRLARPEPEGVLGSAGVLEHRRTVGQRPVRILTAKGKTNPASRSQHPNPARDVRARGLNLRHRTQHGYRASSARGRTTQDRHNWFATIDRRDRPFVPNL